VSQIWDKLNSSIKARGRSLENDQLIININLSHSMPL